MLLPTTPFELLPSLTGQTVSLRAMTTEDFNALYECASDPLIWAIHPEPTRYQRPVFEKFFNAAMAEHGALVILDKASGAIIGTTRFYEWDEHKKEVAIGSTFLSRSYWGGATNREIKALMIDHSFQWASLIWFHVGKDNLRSRRAVEKLGARFSHEGSLVNQGEVRKYVFYRLERDAR